jgi:hypothetical protein
MPKKANCLETAKLKASKISALLTPQLVIIVKNITRSYGVLESYFGGLRNFF